MALIKMIAVACYENIHLSGIAKVLDFCILTGLLYAFRTLMFIWTDSEAGYYYT